MYTKFGTCGDRLKSPTHEGKAASALDHPNIVTIYEIGEENGIDYIAMECVEGRTLADHLKPSGLPLDETVRLALQLADAILGTVSYMSPEQAEWRAVDARSDIFSCGAVLYEMATGRRAFQKSSPTATMAAVLRDSADTKGIPAGLAAVITRCLHKEAERRFQSMAEVRDALHRLAGVSKPAALKKQGLLGAVAASIALMAGGAWWWGSRAERLPPMRVTAFATEAAV